MLIVNYQLSIVNYQLSTIRGVRVQGALIGTDDEVGGPGDEG